MLVIICQCGSVRAGCEYTSDDGRMERVILGVAADRGATTKRMTKQEVALRMTTQLRCSCRKKKAEAPS